MVGSPPTGPRMAWATPLELAPHLIQQAAAATACPAARTTASPTTASATTSSPALGSRRHLVCLCVSLPLLLVRSRLAEAHGVTRRAESVGSRSSQLADAKLPSKVAAGLAGICSS